MEAPQHRPRPHIAARGDAGGAGVVALSRPQPAGAKFSRQMPLGPFFADFLCRELALVIELDGHSHDVAPERDASRDAWMAERGYAVLRFTNAEVLGNVEGAVTTIRLEVMRLRSSRTDD